MYSNLYINARDLSPLIREISLCLDARETTNMTSFVICPVSKHQIVAFSKNFNKSLAAISNFSYE